MTRAAISSLAGTAKGQSLLWIHMCLLFWVTLSWVATLFWIINGTFRLRASIIVQLGEEAAATAACQAEEGPRSTEVEDDYYQHPHPQYPFRDVPSKARDQPCRGLRLRTVMVSSIPSSLRNEKDLREYFEYYMSRKVEKPSMGLTSSTQPGLLNKCLAFVFNRAKKLPARLPANPLSARHDKSFEDGMGGKDKEAKRKSGPKKGPPGMPLIERVVVARKMTELASLLERREEILTNLETAHIKLANKTLMAVKVAKERREAHKPISCDLGKSAEIAKQQRLAVGAGVGTGVDHGTGGVDVEQGEVNEEGTVDNEERMNQLMDVLLPFVEEFGTERPLSTRSKKAISRTSRQAFRRLRNVPSEDLTTPTTAQGAYPPSPTTPSPPTPNLHPVSGRRHETIWDALLSLPRSSLDAYQPLVNLSHLFRGQTVPSIDYYTAKLNLLTSLITENRAKSVVEYDAVSTAFVTFADPADARRACKYLAVHPNNPLACLVTMAPEYQDIDWYRVMKSSYKGEVGPIGHGFYAVLIVFSSL